MLNFTGWGPGWPDSAAHSLNRDVSLHPERKSLYSPGPARGAFFSSITGWLVVSFRNFVIEGFGTAKRVV